MNCKSVLNISYEWIYIYAIYVSLALMAQRGYYLSDVYIMAVSLHIVAHIAGTVWSSLYPDLLF